MNNKYLNPETTGNVCEAAGEFFRLEHQKANQIYTFVEEMEHDHKLNHTGWVSTLTYQPFKDEEMYEWRDDTLGEALSLNPHRVLDIGCGSGMLLFSLVDKTEEYVGLDIAKAGIEYVASRLDKSQKKKTSLYVMDGFDIDKLEDTDFDLVIINSVTQYMGGEEHFAALISKCAAKLAKGGKILLGDIKEAWNRERFYAAWELSRNSDHSDLEERIAARRNNDFEFYMTKEFLESLKEKVPRIKRVAFFAKRGNYVTEMNLFRFNAILYLDDPQDTDYEVTDCTDKKTVEIKKILSETSNSDTLKFTNIKNKFLLQYFCDVLGEKHDLECSMLFIEAADILNERGYESFAMISNDSYECFDIVAKRAEKSI